MANTRNRPRHPNKHIEQAISYAELNGWDVTLSKRGHAWGRIRCSFHDRDGCKLSVWSTPRSYENHAKDIMRSVNRCPHIEQED
jgi:hypothetical protein